MKKTLIFLALLCIMAGSSSSVFGQKGDLNGIWKLDRTKSTVTTEWPVLSRIRIEIKGDSLLTERFYDTADGQQFPFTEKLTLDRKEYLMTIYDMPRKIKANWLDQQSSLQFESATTFSGSAGAEDFVSIETWKVDKAAGLLTISYKNKVSVGDSEGTLIFIKE